MSSILAGGASETSHRRCFCLRWLVVLEFVSCFIRFWMDLWDQFSFCRLQSLYSWFRRAGCWLCPFLAGFREAPDGVVLALRQRQHHGEQPFRFQRQPRVAQVVVCHHRVIAGFLNAKYRHDITSFQRFGKVFVFGGKRRSLYCPDTPEGKKYGR